MTGANSVPVVARRRGSSPCIVGAKQHDEADGRRSGRAGEGGESGEREPEVIAAHTRSLNLYITLA